MAEPDEMFMTLREQMTVADRGTLNQAGVPESLHRVFAVAAFHASVVHIAVRRDGDFAFESAAPYSAVRVGEIEDIVRFPLASPDRWETTLGRCDLLGCASFAQTNGRGHVRVWRTPLKWLQAGGAGVCVLTRDRVDRKIILSQFPRLFAEDAAHATDLERLLGTSPDAPRLFIPANQQNARRGA